MASSKITSPTISLDLKIYVSTTSLLSLQMVFVLETVIIFKYFLTFDDIIEKFPDATKRELFVAAETTDLAIAVKGLDQEVVDAIIDMLPQKKQAMYEPYEGPISKKEVEENIDINSKHVFIFQEVIGSQKYGLLKIIIFY